MLAYSARKPFCLHPYPGCAEPESPPHRSALPGSGCQPVPGFAAQLMAGLDGIINKIHPGDAMDKNPNDLPPEEAAEVPTVAGL